MASLLQQIRSFLGLNTQHTQSSQASQLLLQDPIPLYSKKHQLALFWSAKSGCTYGVKWFFHHTGMLKTALAHSGWVHDYREEVLTLDETFRGEIQTICQPSTRSVKLVRNPFSRAVSSYLMAVRAGYENDAIGEFLNRPVNNDQGFSFREFLDYLGSIDRRHCNIHHRLQVHPAEEAGLVKPCAIIHLENSFKETADCEKQLGLPPSELATFRASGHNTSRRNWSEFWGEVPLFRHLGNKILPDTANFYNNELATKVAELFHEDFARYGYSSDAIPGRKERKGPLALVKPEELLESIIRQLPASGPILPAEKIEGFWPDGWCATNLQAEFTTTQDIHQLSLTGCLPGELLSGNRIRLSAGDATITSEVDNLNDFRLNLPLAVPADQTIVLKVHAEQHRSGAESGLNDDPRPLAFFLKEINFS